MNINVDRIGICEALIDTGADLSVVDLSTALNTGLEIINPDKMCSGPDGKELDIVGNIILNIKFEDKTITHQFVIMRTHLRIFILGRDFLKKMNAKIDCQREIIKYDLTENRDVIKYQQKKIKSAKDAIIPELSIKLMNAFVEAEDGEYIIEENHKMFQTNGLRLARSLINVVNKETYIWITNPYPRPLKILKNQTLCFGSQPAEVNLMEESEQKEHEEPQFQINENLAYTEKEQLKQVLEKYEDLFSSGLGRSNLAKHRIDTEGAKPIKHKPYRVSAKEREIIKEQIDEMLRDGIIRPSSSPWSFPVILVKKRDGKYRFCVDYRKLNDVTVKDVYPIPRIDEVLDTLHGSKYFSAIDLKSGYWQVEVEEKDKEKTAFTTAHGLYEFNVMPFGLCNAPATFERNMENMLDVHRLPLTQNHRRLRRQWCDERRMWMAEWNEIVFNDESRFCLQHHDGRIRVWKHRGERMLNSCVMHRHTGPAPGIMLHDGRIRVCAIVEKAHCQLAFDIVILAHHLG
ncbi:K02A2.6-like [Cordylochernes scorpioides]|uniref:K02A2.6-like n=1 Tax=Cordylochernes scorpioides TaxID=51811 RepID=A0ABY6L4E1_9ARAC|nr:K02A2.6-like [Cordylochernes scorpioides]